MSLIRHTEWDNSCVDLQRAFRETSPGTLIALIGCSGVGKSALRRHVMKGLYGAQSFWPDNVTPAIEAMALLAKGSYFSSLHFVASLKREVLFPDLRWMLANGRSDSDAWIDQKMGEIDLAREKLPNPRWRTETKEWELLAETCHLYKCELIAVDHATCMLVNHKDMTPADHLFNLTSWSEKTGVRIILTGIETLPDLWAEKGEIRRRVRKVWMAPYRDDSEGLKAFGRLVASFLMQFDAKNRQAILGMTRELHMATGGLIGELHRLFFTSASCADGLTPDGIASCYYSDREIENLWCGVESFWKARKIARRENLEAAKRLGRNQAR